MLSNFDYKKDIVKGRCHCLRIIGNNWFWESYYEPLNSSWILNEPVNSSGIILWTLELFSNLIKKPSLVILYDPLNSSGILYEPLNSSGILYKLLNSSVILYEPLNSSGILNEPLNSSEILLWTLELFRNLKWTLELFRKSIMNPWTFQES